MDNANTQLPEGGPLDGRVRRLVDRLLKYSDIRRSDPRENREALRDLIVGEIADALHSVRNAERERCARLCEQMNEGQVAAHYDWTKTVGNVLADVIRKTDA